MADVDINPFSDHNKTDSHPDETGENTPVIAGGVGGSTWEPEPECKTLLRGISLREEVLKEHIKGFC